ncbi:MAG: ATP-binding cassette domain-containing protein [Paracoccaceae bacterium]
MTAISAVIFLVSARYDMATSYIIGRVENNDYGLAIAYSTALIFVMLAAVGLLQLLVGRTQIGRRLAHEQGGDDDHRQFQSRLGRLRPCDQGLRQGCRGGGRCEPDNRAPGKLVTLLGPSGCGKTTTLRMIAGLEMATSGRILIGEKDVTTLPATDRDVSMVFQSYALFPHMTVLENVSYGLKFSGFSKAETLEAGQCRPVACGTRRLRRALAVRAFRRPAAAGGRRPRAGAGAAGATFR